MTYKDPLHERVAADLFGYTVEVPSYGSVYTVLEFAQMCKSRFFIDYDGYGHPVLGGKAKPSCWVKPSSYDTDIPEEATHVVWYNR